VRSAGNTQRHEHDYCGLLSPQPVRAQQGRALWRNTARHRWPPARPCWRYLHAIQPSCHHQVTKTTSMVKTVVKPSQVSAYHIVRQILRVELVHASSSAWPKGAVVAWCVGWLPSHCSRSSSSQRSQRRSSSIAATVSTVSSPVELPFVLSDAASLSAV
jgi:hypothetical protein